MSAALAPSSTTSATISLRLGWRRGLTDIVMQGLCGAAAIGAGAVLLLLLGHVTIEGASALSPTLLTSLPTPLGVPGGGIAHAIAGSMIMVGLACLWGVPLGIGAGVYLSEFAGIRTGGVVRFTADVLSGVPSIVTGIFAYSIVVAPMGSFSGIAGAFALGLITLPIVARTTEEVMRLVPAELREASLALGVPRWRTIASIVLPTASTGVLTGAMLALARVAGETAPLIFTALGNNFFSLDPSRPMAAVTLTIFQYAIWPYQYLQHQAWAASLLLVAFILLVNVVVRLIARNRGVR